MFLLISIEDGWESRSNMMAFGFQEGPYVV